MGVISPITGNGLLGAGASLLGSGLNALFGNSQANKAFERQKDLMALQNRYAVENWNRENAYNTPAAQMQRLKAAGLNPNLIYEGGSAGLQSGAIGSTSAPSAPMAPASAPNFQGALSDAVSTVQGLSMAKKTNSETVYQDLRNKYVEKEIVTALQNMEMDIDLKDKQGQNIIQSISESQERIDRMRAQTDNETYDRVLSTLSTIGQLDRWRHENLLSDEQRKWIGTNAMAALIGAKGAYAQATAMANAVNLFRDPHTFAKFIEEVKNEIRSHSDNLPKTIVDDLCDSFELLKEGRYWEAFVTGRKDKPSKTTSGVR